MNQAEAVIADWEVQLHRERNYPLPFYWQWRVLFELIALQMEYAWKQGSKTAPERYASIFSHDFSNLLDVNQKVQLLAEEFRLRWRFGDKPNRQHFLKQYSSARPELEIAIARVESELQREFGWQPGVEDPLPSNSSLAAQAPLSSADFLVQRFIGAGSMGRVYVAKQHSLDRPVAIKFLRSILSATKPRSPVFCRKAGLPPACGIPASL